MNGNTQKKSLRADPFSLVMRVLVWGAALLTAGVLLALIAYILIRGVPNLKLSLFELEYNSENVSMFPSIVMTIYMTVLTLIITTPLGIGCAIYLTEYAKRGNKVVEVIRLAAETLSGIPSIVYGLFGMLFFVTALQWKTPFWPVPALWPSWCCPSSSAPPRRPSSRCPIPIGKPASAWEPANCAP